MIDQSYFQPSKSVFDILKMLRKKPQIHIGAYSIIRLHAFILGCKYGLNVVGQSLSDQEIFNEFNPWVAGRLGFGESTSGWCNMILEKSKNDEEAFHSFYFLFDEFCEYKKINLNL